nr:hypothetical protein L203_02772 [Cryptococcus depauperatus CBS 7841]
MYDGPIRGGNRGGQGDFRWSAVANDKHRGNLILATENYLGHSINAPVGRWTKHKDVHWYNRDVDENDTAKAARERAEEIKRLKQQEEDALAAALGYAVPKKDAEGGGDGLGTGANDIPVKKSEKDDEISKLEKEERKREKALRKEQRALKRAEKEIKREEKERRKHQRLETRRNDDSDRERQHGGAQRYHYREDIERDRGYRHKDRGREDHDERVPHRDTDWDDRYGERRRDQGNKERKRTEWDRANDQRYDDRPRSNRRLSRSRSP